MNPPKDFVATSSQDNLETFPSEPAGDASTDAASGEATLFKLVQHEPGSTRPSRLASRSMAPRGQGVLARPLKAARAKAVVQASRLRRFSTRSVSGLLLTGTALSVVLSLGLYALVLRERPRAPVAPARASVVLTSMEPFTYPALDRSTDASAAVLQDNVVLAADGGPARRRPVAPAAKKALPPPAVEPDEPGLPVTFGKIPQATPAVTDSADRIPALPETSTAIAPSRPASPPPATPPAPAPVRPSAATAPPPAESSVRLPAAPPPPPASATASRTPDTTTVAAIVHRYRIAFSNLDASALVKVWPSVNTREIGQAFNEIDSQAFTFDRCVTQPRTGAVVVTCSGRAAWVPRVGNRSPRVESRRWTFTLERASQGWVIREVATQRIGL